MEPIQAKIRFYDRIIFPFLSTINDILYTIGIQQSKQNNSIIFMYNQDQDIEAIGDLNLRRYGSDIFYITSS